MKRHRYSHINRTHNKTRRLNPIPIVHAITQSPDAPYSVLLDDLPTELRLIIRSFLDPESRVCLQQTCWLLYLEDPGLIILPHIIDCQRMMESLLTPTSVFAVNMITADCEFLETYPGRTVYSNFKAHMLDQINKTIPLPGLTKKRTPLAVCGLGDLDQLLRYISYSKYVTNEKVDRAKVIDNLATRIIMFNEDSDDEETWAAKRTITKDRLDEEIVDVKRKYRKRRALVAYTMKRKQERLEWEEKMGVTNGI